METQEQQGSKPKIQRLEELERIVASQQVEIADLKSQIAKAKAAADAAEAVEDDEDDDDW